MLTEKEARVSFLAALARSQQALARMLESVADIVDCSPEGAKLLLDNVRSLTDMKEEIAESVTILQWRRRVKRVGVPAKPWLQPALPLSAIKRSGGGGEAGKR
ncbi:hypothetical protein MHI37_21730 [Paenibacillus sp. FSL H8-0548]|uniref:hypothetical protein n=1 Tax=Paenibacillus sp. FSL H8-0548 TaxID=1920422 RepID=UPI00117FBF9E|nr:hypothetical protein [Paenibacillus sp. FSL H8-0548]